MKYPLGTLEFPSDIEAESWCKKNSMPRRSIPIVALKLGDLVASKIEKGIPERQEEILEKFRKKLLSFPNFPHSSHITEVEILGKIIRY